MAIPININVIKWWTTLSPTIRNITSLVFITIFAVGVAQYFYTEKERSNTELIKQLPNSNRVQGKTKCRG